jgi:hypothetical protein
MKTKRLVIISDLHCGHRSGLTPAEWQWKNSKDTRGKFAAVQRTLWKFYTETIDSLKPIQALVVNGDAIDGKGPKAGSSEHITADRKEQADMAAECIKYARAPNIYLTYGTPYHTGASEDWEDIVAEKVGASIKDHLWLDINGLVFDIKHKVGGSSIPHGRHTALARSKLWEQLWADAEERKPADVLIRSHVHYHTFGGDPQSLYMTTPALQAYSKYGTRQCEGLIHMGLIWFDVNEGSYTWQSKLLEAKSFKSEPIKL